ncbi:ABC-2 type transporter [Corynebacterium kalinowskii]|uniref:Transport permease protein n=1 Tax=Corynebacterium kalinowskii TaxID=2675216 RepID=A0A6B8W5Z2_9CORY|nr:ABC transporter permease [Corynebacterium kalinowskii]QGU02668.1 ABC-2 type transporter [Corynebacterium kalinowskii]
MRGYPQLTKALLASMSRDPIGFFFLVFFSPLLLIIFGQIFGNEPDPEFGGRGFIDNMLPGLTVIAIMMTGVMAIPQNHLALRASGALARLRVTPLRARTFVAADLTVNFLLGFVGAALTLVLGVLVFDIEAPKHVLGVLAAFALGLLAMMAIGYTLASLYPSVAAATGIGNVLMIVLMLTSGAFIPKSVLPAGIEKVMNASPVFHLAELVRASWAGNSWPTISSMVVVGTLVVFGVLGTVLFRWNK